MQERLAVSLARAAISPDAILAHAGRALQETSDAILAQEQIESAEANMQNNIEAQFTPGSNFNPDEEDPFFGLDDDG